MRSTNHGDHPHVSRWSLHMRALLPLLLILLITSINAEPVPIRELGKLIKDQRVDRGAHLEYRAVIDDLLPDLSDEDSFTIMLTPLSGDADLCLTTNDKPLPANFDKEDCNWYSAGGYGDVVIIPRNHDKWPTGDDARFNIGVYGRTPSNFMINTWTSETHIILEPGLPQNAQVSSGNYSLFKFKLEGKRDFHVGVTPRSGDPDLYVSTTLEKPNKEECTSKNCWIATKYEYDVIFIDKDEDKFVEDGVYYIAVYGWFDTAFSVYATPKGDYTTLPEGYPLSDTIERQEYRYYKFWMTTSGIRQTWTVMPLTQGDDPDLFVRIQKDEDDKGQDKPSKEEGKYDWKSNTLSEDSVIIKDAEGGKWYYAAVYGYGKINNYRIVAGTEQSSTLLNDGNMQTITALSPGAYYFKYFHGDDLSAVTFTASGVSTDAKVKMYYSSEISNPDKDKNERQGEKMGSRTYMYFSTPARVGTYYLTVTVDKACNFTMLAATNQTTTVLADNVLSFFNHAPAGYYRYFVFDQENLDSDLTISVDPWLEGDVDLYVSNTTERPTKEHAEWRSENYKQDTVVIYSEELKRMESHRFYIGVYAGYDSYFSIIAYSASTTSELQDGQPVNGIVRRGQSRFYKLRVQGAAALTITLEMTGSKSDADLYADFNNPKPSPTDHKWKGTKLGNDVIFIEDYDGGQYPWIYIAVRGIYGPDDEVPFRLDVTQNYQIMRPNWGQLVEVTRKGKANQFQAIVNNYADFVVLSTTLINGRTKMYVKTNSSIVATPENADFASEDWPANSILVKRDDPKFRPGQWSVTVQAAENSDYFVSLVQKAEWTFGSPLKETVPHVGRVPSGEWTMFNFYMPYEPTGKIKKDWVLNVNTMSGDINVFVSQDHEHVPPTEEHHYWATYGPNDRVMLFYKEKLASGPLFIAVYGRNPDLTDSVFELTLAEHDAARYLPIDQPQEYVVSFKDVHYRVLAPMLDKDEKQATIVVESCDMLTAPNLYGSAANSKPSPRTNYTSESIAENGGLKKIMTGVIPPAKDTDKTNEHAFYITVEGDIPGSPPNAQVYSLSTTFDENIPKPIVASGKDRYWSVSASGPNKLKLEIYKGQPSPRFSKTALQYDIYLAETNRTHPAEQINMITVCGVQLFGTRAASIRSSSLMSADESDIVTAEFEIDTSKTYLVNVLVHNGFGVYNIYHQSWIINGEFYQDYPQGFWGFLSPLSVGFFLIIFFILGIVLYLGIGAIVQYVRGKRGVEVIPNYYFWIDVPHLLLDGLRLIGSICVRRPKQYRAFSDEPDTVDTSGFDTGAPAAHKIYGEGIDEEDEYGLESGAAGDNAPGTSSDRGGYGTL